MSWKNVKAHPESVDLSGTITDLYSIIEFLQVRPCSIWEDGVTYFVGSEDEAVSNQTIQVYKYVHATSTFSYQQVGAGSDSASPQNHNVSFIWREGTNWYVGQSNPHNGEIDLWKSDTDDVITTWTEQTQIAGDNAYPRFFIDYNGDTALGCRLSSPEGAHDVGLKISSTGIEGSFTNYRLTINDNESNHWYYPQYPIMYGTNTKQYVIGQLRSQATSDIFCHGIFVSDGDYDNWHNYADTFTKDISIEAVTNAEFETNYVFNGTNATDTDDLSLLSAVQIDDVLYVVAIKDGTTDHYIWKLTGTTLTSTLVNISNLSRGNGLHSMYLYYNGENLILSCKVDDGVTITVELWTMPMDLSSFTQRYTLEVPHDATTLIKLPENLDEVTGEFVSYVYSAASNAYLLLTTEKFWE